MRNLLLLLLLCCGLSSFGQDICNDFYYKQFSRAAIIKDLDFIHDKILHAHINPFTGITPEQFEAQFGRIKASLPDSMMQHEFYFKAMPIFNALNDEHSHLEDYCITDSLRENFKIFPLRFKLQNDKVLLTENYSQVHLKPGDELLSVNGIKIDDMLDSCTNMIAGAKESRKATFVDQMWIYLPRYCYFIKDSFQLVFRSGKRVTVEGLYKLQFAKVYKPVKKTPYSIVFNTYGDVAYLTVNDFNDQQTIKRNDWDRIVDSIFTVIQRKHCKTLFVDVSENTGGNSGIGDLIISYFNDKPYADYSGKWKKSQEYLQVMKDLKLNDPAYEKLHDGEIMPIPSDMVHPANRTNRFTGKTYIVIGKRTFSSAMMFAVLSRDNKLATLIGETPIQGHPNGFGELIWFKTPNTKLGFMFSVKEWIRPSGETTNNQLVPDISIPVENSTPKQIISRTLSMK
ncbi:C-terminal processing protease CtpA/Prc [Chitinophaga dinghuensis]|uniref:C-terminal processing protease CtpA/Prc n=1 Tax=Chitinophaga dinghuensis TaxID=1539050 RepID=A0A327VWY4_9BACT|nr:S41 family peptidase [Chitinophaga dinghuensis]RAJ75691.1 C-terminal processing protease CtpA/Prc [Chitinophaga dinghuensis]